MSRISGELCGLPGGAFEFLNSFAIPYVGLGTKGLIGRLTAERAIEAAILAGYRHFDVSLSYGNLKDIGRAINNALAKFGLKRTQITITASVELPSDDVDNVIQKQVNETLESLQTTFVDVLVIASPYALGTDDSDVKNQKRRRLAYQRLEVALQDRKVRTLGVCDFDFYHVIELKCFCRYPPMLLQTECHPHCSHTELVRFAAAERMLVQATNPLGRCHPNLLEEKVLTTIAARKGVSVQEIILSWLLHRGLGVLPASVKPNHIAQNMTACSVSLSKDEMALIDKLDKDISYRRYRQ